MKHGVLYEGLERLLAVGAWPVGRLEAAITRTGQRRWAIEAFQLSCLAGALAGLLVCGPAAVLAFWALLRLMDIAHVHVRLFGLGALPSSAPRSVLFLFLHYTEVVVLCAVLYLWVQALAPSGVHLFLRAPDGPQALTPMQALFFSFTTATTIGFGDISPHHAAPVRWVGMVYAITWFKAMLVVFLTVVELSRILASRR